MLANIRCSLPPECRRYPALDDDPSTDGPPRTAIPVRPSHLLTPVAWVIERGDRGPKGPRGLRLLPTRGRNKGADHWLRAHIAPRKGALAGPVANNPGRRSGTTPTRLIPVRGGNALLRRRGRLRGQFS